MDNSYRQIIKTPAIVMTMDDYTRFSPIIKTYKECWYVCDLNKLFTPFGLLTRSEFNAVYPRVKWTKIANHMPVIDALCFTRNAPMLIRNDRGALALNLWHTARNEHAGVQFPLIHHMLTFTPKYLKSDRALQKIIGDTTDLWQWMDGLVIESRNGTLDDSLQVSPEIAFRIASDAMRR